MSYNETDVTGKLHTCRSMIQGSFELSIARINNVKVSCVVIKGKVVQVWHIFACASNLSVRHSTSKNMPGTV